MGIPSISCIAHTAFVHFLVPASICMQVLEERQGSNCRVNLKERGDCFGEISLMYDCARSATVASTTDAVVWVLERDVFRYETSPVYLGSLIKDVLQLA